MLVQYLTRAVYLDMADPDDVQAKLNHYSELGWRLVTVVPYEGQNILSKKWHVHYFEKRVS